MALENFAIIYIFALWVFTLVGVSSYTVAVLLGPGHAQPAGDGVPVPDRRPDHGHVPEHHLLLRGDLTYRLSLNPDDHGIPLTSSAIDSIGAIALMAVIFALGLGAVT